MKRAELLDELRHVLSILLEPGRVSVHDRPYDRELRCLVWRSVTGNVPADLNPRKSSAAHHYPDVLAAAALHETCCQSRKSWYSHCTLHMSTMYKESCQQKALNTDAMIDAWATLMQVGMCGVSHP